MVSIFLGKLGINSRVLIDAVDITGRVVAVEVRASILGPSEVVLTLIGPVEIHGEPGVLEINPRTDADG